MRYKFISFITAILTVGNVLIILPNADAQVRNQPVFKASLEDHQDHATTQANAADYHHHQGIVLQSYGSFQKAIDHFSKAVALAPDQAAYLFSRGLARADLGNWRMAIQDYTLALSLEPTLKAAYYNRGLAWFALQEQTLAVQDFTAALKLEPSFVAAYYHRGLAYYDQGQEHLARQDYEQSRQLSPTLTLIADYYDQGFVRPLVGGDELAEPN